MWGSEVVQVEGLGGWTGTLGGLGSAVAGKEVRTVAWVLAPEAGVCCLGGWWEGADLLEGGGWYLCVWVAAVVQGPRLWLRRRVKKKGRVTASARSLLGVGLVLLCLRGVVQGIWPGLHYG